jgi:hypothetical protein
MGSGHKVKDIAAAVAAVALEGEGSVWPWSDRQARCSVRVPGATYEEAVRLGARPFVEPQLPADETNIDQLTPDIPSAITMLDHRSCSG